MLDNFINPYVFIISFAISILIVYVVHPEPTVIYKHPSPKNAGKYTYKNDTIGVDGTETCYKYEANEVKCPSDPNLIIEHPLIIK